MNDSDTASAAVERARSYLLFNSLVNNVMTFALGGKLLGEDSDDDHHTDDEQEQENVTEQGHGQDRNTDDEGQATDELTSLLPNVVQNKHQVAGQKIMSLWNRLWERLPEVEKEVRAVLGSHSPADSMMSHAATEQSVEALQSLSLGIMPV